MVPEIIREIENNMGKETMKKAAAEALAKAQEGIKAILKDNPFKINLGIIIVCDKDFSDIE